LVYYLFVSTPFLYVFFFTFFFYSSVHHRDLHSFPTRRSSDLLIVHCAAQPSHEKAREIPLLDFEVNALGTVNLLEATRQRVDSRSEEHTSELQSLAYLVCRLLLEKKKKK